MSVTCGCTQLSIAIAEGLKFYGVN